MASITKRGDGQWQVKICRKGWPAQSGTFATRKLALDWAHRTENEMAAGHFVDRTEGQRMTLGELVELYLRDVIEKRPDQQHGQHLSWNCPSPLPWYFAPRERHHGIETKPAIPRLSSSRGFDERSAAQTGCGRFRDRLLAIEPLGSERSTQSQEASHPVRS